MFPTVKTNLNLPNSDISYFSNFFSENEALSLYNSILNETNWQQDNITVYGKTYAQPRLTALFANNNKPYSYSNITMHPAAFTETLLKIKAKIEGIIPKAIMLSESLNGPKEISDIFDSTINGNAK